MNNFHHSQIDTIYQKRLINELPIEYRRINIPPIPSEPEFYLYGIFLLPFNRCKEYLVPYIFRGKTKDDMESKSNSIWATQTSILLIQNVPTLLPIAYQHLQNIQTPSNIPPLPQKKISRFDKLIEKIRQQIEDINYSSIGYQRVECDNPSLTNDLVSLREQVKNVIHSVNTNYEYILLNLAKFKYTEENAQKRVNDIMPTLRYLIDNYKDIINNPLKYSGKGQEYGINFDILLEQLIIQPNIYYYL